MRADLQDVCEQHNASMSQVLRAAIGVALANGRQLVEGLGDASRASKPRDRYVQQLEREIAELRQLLAEKES